MSGDLAFALADPFRVRLKEARYDSRGTCFFATAPRDAVEYDVDSALLPLEPPANAPAVIAPGEYLQLPPGLDRVREIARRVPRDGPRPPPKGAHPPRNRRRNG